MKHPRRAIFTGPPIRFGGGAQIANDLPEIKSSEARRVTIEPNMTNPKPSGQLQTPMNSNQVFTEFCNEIAASRGLSHSEAIDEANRIKPDLAVLVNALGAPPTRAQFFSESLQRKICGPFRAEKRTEFIGLVHDYMDRFKVEYDPAWTACKRQHAQLFNEMTNGGIPTVANGGSAPVAGPGVCASMHISPGAVGRQDVFEAAWAANGRQLSPLDAAAVFEALVQFFMKEKNASHDAAMEYCTETFPNLWTDVKALGKG